MPCFANRLTMLFSKVPFPDRFECAAQAGFDAVELLLRDERPAAWRQRWTTVAGRPGPGQVRPPGVPSATGQMQTNSHGGPL